MPEIVFTRHDRSNLPDKQLLIDVHADACADQMDDEFHQRFPWFVDHWTSMPGFTCVVAHDGSEAVGFAYGAPLTRGREWWRGHVEDEPQGETYAVSELMVRPRWRKQGISRRLHDQLLAGRPEELAVLLVDTTHPRVRDCTAPGDTSR